MAQKPAPRGQTQKHAAHKNHKHHKAHHNGKHHPGAKKSHLALQQEVSRLVEADVQKTLAHLGIKKPWTPKRGLALAPGGVSCCAAEGLAASARLAGATVTHDDVLALYFATASDPDTGASILETLEAARRLGLGGIYPASFAPATLLADGVVAGLTLPCGPHAVTLDGNGVRTWGEWRPASRSLAGRLEEAWVITWQ